MPRTVDHAAHARRRNGFLDAAQRLIHTKGYARMTIEDVLKELGTSKGALYHYFDSKQALLEGIVDRMTEAAETHLRQNAERDAASGISALDELRQFFITMGQWKADRRELLLATLPLRLSDDNAIVRQKMRVRMIERLSPWLTSIIERGVREGVFTTPYPDQVGRLLVGVGQEMKEDTLPLLVSGDVANLSKLERIASSYIDALERILGAPSGSLAMVIDREKLRAWFDAAQEAKGRHNDQVH